MRLIMFWVLYQLTQMYFLIYGTVVVIHCHTTKAICIKLEFFAMLLRDLAVSVTSFSTSFIQYR